MATNIEKHPAIVTKNDDPTKRGRIMVRCFGLTADPDVEYPEWIDPVFDWSLFLIPDIGEEVEIEAVVSDDQSESKFQAFLEEPRVIWRGKRFFSDGGEQPRPPNDLFTSKNYGKRRGMGTPAGHVLLFDDTAGDEQVLLSARIGDRYAFLSMQHDGSIVLLNSRGSMLSLNASEAARSAALIDEHGNSVVLDEAGIRAIDTRNNSIATSANGITVLAAGAVNMQASGAVAVRAANVQVDAAQVIVDSGDVQIGTDADSPFVRWNEFQPWALGHTHPDAFGGTGPASAGLVQLPDEAASTTATVRSTAWAFFVLLVIWFWWAR